MSRQERIEHALRENFAPTHIEVTNDSDRHSVAPGSETHFTVLLVSASFAETTRIERHRRVHAALSGELDAGLHALAIRALAPSEYDAATPFQSPDCLGGSKIDRKKKKSDEPAPDVSEEAIDTPRNAEAIHE